MTAIEDELRKVVDDASSRLLELSDTAAATPRARGKWSPKEILGHLIDSASNNHHRFVRAQLTADLEFPGYQQEEWVSAQRYQSAPWPALIGLWMHFNLHLARVIEAIPAASRQAPRARHNLHEIAWQPVPRDRPTTLEYLLRDYVGHLRHHLAQILGPDLTGS